MKFVAAVALLALVGSSMAQNAPAVQAAITAWTNDINDVNNFLNNILASTNPAQDALNILPFAQDEPNQLAVLQANLNPADANGLRSVQFLMQNFPTVVTALTAIANNIGNQDVVKANVAVINSIRCGVVLKNIGFLFEAAEADNGITPPTFPNGPNVCPNFDNLGNFPVVAPLL